MDEGVRESDTVILAGGGRWERPGNHCRREGGWDEEDELDDERSGLDDVGLERVANGWELDEVVRETGALETEGAPSDSEPGRT